MTTASISRMTAGLLSGLLLPGRASALEVSPISVRVEQVAKGDHDKFAHTQERSLKVFLTNGSDRDYTALRVKYFFFARDLKDGEVLLYEKGEKKTDVAAHATVVVETPAATAHYTDEHTQGNPFGGKARKRGGGKGQKTKSIPARGKRLVGHAVQIFTGGKLIGEVYSEPSLKAKIGS